jgi:membrane-bound lytic murein transglycosylase D
VKAVSGRQSPTRIFELYLPEETDRYIYRIAAIKEIVANPKKYGLTIDQKDSYKPFIITEFTLEVKRDIHTVVLAQAMDVSYKTFRELNLHLRKYTLPKGFYYLCVPAEKKDTFLRRLKENQSLAIQNRDRS